MFYSGCLINIPNDFKAGKNVCCKGVYKLGSIWEKGPAEIISNCGIKILTSAANLVAADFSKLN